MSGPRAPRWGDTSPPQTLPLFPLTGALLLPGGQMPLNIFEPRYLAMTDAALGGARLIGMIQPREDGVKPQLYDVGCAGRITSFVETGDGRYLINLTGFRRFRVAEELATDTPYRIARPDWDAFAIDAHADETAGDADRDALLAALKVYLRATNVELEWQKAAAAPIEALVVSLAMGCPFAPSEKQALLEAMTIADQAAILTTLMNFSGADPSDADDGAPPLQ